MLNFRFWNSDQRGSEKLQTPDYPMLDLDFTKPAQPWLSTDIDSTTSAPIPPKRRRESNAAIASQGEADAPVAKRQRTGTDHGSHKHADRRQEEVPSIKVNGSGSSVANTPSADLERATEVIEEQLGMEILLKHDELRLINQEIAKCQVALEQLRRCHLMPYPVNIPTPEQMLRISSGSGPSLQPKAGEQLPQWAPPFGVTEGPYARHYAKWLIPDPKFDGIYPQVSVQADAWRTRSAAEGRSTRNSFAELSTPQGKGRPSRSTAGQKLQSLSSGYPPPKDKNGPCTLKRSDGQTVKLVCIDCQRENFSSTQGFINHCRIAHKRDFKSHEEAAVHCGHPIKVPEPINAAIVEEKAVAPPPLPSGLVHPFTRENAMSESEACFSVVRRIQESIALYRKGNSQGSPNGTSTAVSQSTKARLVPKSSPGFTASAESPHLSRLLQTKGIDVDLSALVEDAKSKIDDEPFSETDDDSGYRDSPMSSVSSCVGKPIPTHMVSTGMRVPSRGVMAPAASTQRPLSSKGALARPTHLVTPLPTPIPSVEHIVSPDSGMSMDEDMLDATELSPHTAISNNAPSLVSDDGEYDDSADSDSASEMGDSIGASLSDVDEIDIDDEHAGAGSLRHNVRLVQGDNKHVNFVNRVKGNPSPAKQGRDRTMNIDALR
ncbi:hypothetical protein F5Y18DRAFT_21317 [Xylariaceae sp. FL1019]|nr:hypothetical protein F5Y18DRAFT_21317 [Xylariaceae sp. FL1019]